MKENLVKINKSEKGFILALFPFVFITLLASLAMVVDSANIYAAKLKTASASEAAVTNAIASFITETDPNIRAAFGTAAPGQTTQEEDLYLQSRAIQALRSNLLAIGFKDQEAQSDSSNDKMSVKFKEAGLIADTDNTPQGNVLTVTARVEVPTLLMHMVPNLNGKNNDSRGAPPAGSRTPRGGPSGGSSGSENGNNPHANKGNGTTVSGFASAPIVGANFIILLDLSSSQSCPTYADSADGSGYCDCNTPQRNNGGIILTCQQEANAAVAVNGVSDTDLKSIRIQTVRNSLLPVINQLDNGRDRLSIIGFNNSAFVLLPFNGPAGNLNIAQQGFDRDQATAAINRLRTKEEAATYAAEFPGAEPPIIPEGSTNISDAMITAFQEARQARLVANNMPYNIIYYSDGAATAMRASFPGLGTGSSLTPRTLSTTAGNLYAEKFSDNDFINYQVALGNPNDPDNYITTPGPFVKTAEYKRDFHSNVNNSLNGGNILQQVQFVPKDMNPRGYDSDAIATCQKNGNSLSPKMFSINKEERKAAISACFGSGSILGTFNPSSVSTAGSLSFGGPVMNDSEFLTDIGGQFRYLYYIAALNAADFVRRNGGRIYAVGFGPPSSDITDPAQNINDATKQKSAIMANMSNHYYKNEELTKKGYKEFDTLPNYKGDYKKSADRKTAGQSDGVYYESPVGKDLANMITSIVQLAKLRIIGLG